MFSELKRQLTAQRLRELLDYAPDTGRFYWRVRSGRASAGGEAGTWSGDGYRDIKIDGTIYRAHRLDWLFMSTASTRLTSTTSAGTTASPICAIAPAQRMGAMPGLMAPRASKAYLVTAPDGGRALR